MIENIHFILQAIIFVVGTLFLSTIVIVAKKQINIKRYILPFFLNAFFVYFYLTIANRIIVFVLTGNELSITLPTFIFAIIHPTLINILCYSIHYKPRKNEKHLYRKGYIVSCLYGQLLALAIVSGTILM